MKKLILFIFSIMCSQLSAQLTGNAFLNGQTNHSGIKIKFISNGGTAVTDSTITDSNGSFTINIVGGPYKVSYSKAGYLNIDYNNGTALILTNTVVLNSATLTPGNQILVNGNVSGAWTNNNTYIVNGNLTIPFGQTLTVQQGTSIRFNGHYSITANGVFSAVGSQSSPIIFTSNKINPTSNDWHGIVLNTPGSIIEKCSLEYFFIGVEINNCNPSISENEFRNFYGSAIVTNNSSSIIQNNWIHDFKDYEWSIGIQLEGTGGAIVECNKIHNGGGRGVFANTNGIVRNNEIYNINEIGWGILVNYNSPRIENNFIHHCKVGIDIGNNISLPVDPLIINNTITNNSKFGITFTESSGSSSIVNNIVINNGISGVKQNYASAGPSVVSHNLVWNNPNNYSNIQILGIGQIVSTNSNGDPIDSYYNLCQDPLFSPVPNLNSNSPCLNAGDFSYSNNIGFTSTLSCTSFVSAVKNHTRKLFSLNMFPNPSNGIVNIQSDNLSSFCVLEIFNTIGQKVFEKDALQSTNNINLTGLEKGIYLISIKDRGTLVATKKLMLQ